MFKIKLLSLSVPLFVLCLAFDPIDNRAPSIDHESYLEKLMSSEAALLDADSTHVHKKLNIKTLESTFGSDPYRIHYLKNTDHYLVLLRNADKIVLCDSNLQLIATASTPRQPVAFEMMNDDILLVGGELSGTVQRYRIGNGEIERLSSMDLHEVVSVKDMVYVPEVKSLFVLDDFSRRLVQVKILTNEDRQQVIQIDQRSFPIGAGSHRILCVGNHLIINLMLEHTILIIPFKGDVPDLSQATRITNAGPFWAINVVVADGQLVIAAGGVENRSLSRMKGEFGYLDSYLYLFTLDRDSKGRFNWCPHDRKNAQRYRAVNLSTYGVLTPKAIDLRCRKKSLLKLVVTGYGADKAITFTVKSGGIFLDRIFWVLPGISDAAVTSNQKGRFLVFTSPLLDHMAKLDLNTGKMLMVMTPVSPQASKRPIPNHLGEILFFTDLMSSNNSSHGELSRFTCEACHFEGEIDGRTHFTGRENIHTTTKSVHGLANNLPLFSRGGDESLSSMVMAEFLVANQHRRGVFSVQKNDYHWMSTLDNWPDTLTPLKLREGLLSFFSVLKHKPNPWRIKHGALTEDAKRGLVVFRERCSDCHQAIKSTRTEDGIGFEGWQDWLTNENLDLVWGAPFFARTGVTPYVDSAGSRVPSLRRVWMKYPLFTNGSSKTIRDILNDFRYQDSTVWHRVDISDADTAEDITVLTPQEKSDLEMLLRYF